MTNPLYFGMVDHFHLANLDLLNFNYLNSQNKQLPMEVHIVAFTARDLAIPNNNPIGMYYQNGSRKYLWNNKTWGDIDLPCEPLITAITNKLKDLENQEMVLFYNRLLDIVKMYKTNYGPTNNDSFGNRESTEVFYRAIYALNDA